MYFSYPLDMIFNFIHFPQKRISLNIVGIDLLNKLTR